MEKNTEVDIVTLALLVRKYYLRKVLIYDIQHCPDKIIRSSLRIRYRELDVLCGKYIDS